MGIESGPARGAVIRLAVMTVMLLGFAVLFEYDGFVEYPKKNLDVAIQNLRGFSLDRATLKADPRVIKANIERIDRGWTRKQLVTLLGEPVGEVDAEQGRNRTILGFVGPAVWLKVPIERDKVADSIAQGRDWVEAEKTEFEIKSQKVLGVVCLAIGIWLLVAMLRLVALRVVVDDEGLSFAGRKIVWDDMTRLETGRYRDKGWVDLIYQAGGSERMQRIDSYKVDAFDDIVHEICRRKQFDDPVARAEDAAES